MTPLHVVKDVAPVRERGLKFLSFETFAINNSVAPVRERGLKLKSAFYVAVSMASRSREGAWIEIHL